MNHRTFASIAKHKLLLLGLLAVIVVSSARFFFFRPNSSTRPAQPQPPPSSQGTLEISYPSPGKLYRAVFHPSVDLLIGSDQTPVECQFSLLDQQNQPVLLPQVSQWVSYCYNDGLGISTGFKQWINDTIMVFEPTAGQIWAVKLDQQQIVKKTYSSQEYYFMLTNKHLSAWLFNMLNPSQKNLSQYVLLDTNDQLLNTVEFPFDKQRYLAGIFYEPVNDVFVLVEVRNKYGQGKPQPPPWSKLLFYLLPQQSAEPQLMTESDYTRLPTHLPDDFSQLIQSAQPGKIVLEKLPWLQQSDQAITLTIE